LSCLRKEKRENKPDLKENFRPHEEEAVDDTESEHHRHRGDIEGEEPGKGSDGELDVGSHEVLVESRETSLDEVLKDALIENGTVHGGTAEL
jgi:hypothetical protein